VSVLGVRITNTTKAEAIDWMEHLLRGRGASTKVVYIANAHTLNLAAESSEYRDILNAAEAVFGDGTGVRWAARMRGIRMRDNLVGTDLVPLFMTTTRDAAYRYFLLGGTPPIVHAAVTGVGRAYPGVQIAGYHHGHFGHAENADVVRTINAARPDVLLVAMGNPRQELWIHENRAQLRVGLCLGVGGLVDHWGGSLKRAPLWVRRFGFEWLQILLQQPYKWRRYLIGNPQYLVRVTRALAVDRVVTGRGTV